jgi:hypothetical protein
MNMCYFVSFFLTFRLVLAMLKDVCSLLPTIRHDLLSLILREIVLSSRGLVPPGWIEKDRAHSILRLPE